MVVKIYKSAQEYQRDAPQMARLGWEVQAQSSQEGHFKMRRTAFGQQKVQTSMRPTLNPFHAKAARTPDTLTVTWIHA